VTLSKTDRSKIDLWTAHDMSYVVKERGRYPVTIPRFTPCHKPPYTHEILRYFERMMKRWEQPSENSKPVAVFLEGQLRYCWREDVLTKEEYDAAREADRAALVLLLSKPGRAVDQG